MRMRNQPKPVSRVGAILREKMQAHGLGINEVARQMDVSAPFITRIIYGERPMPLDRVEQFAEILGADRDELYLAIDRLPPDVERAIQRHPEMLGIIRAAARQLDEKKGRRP